MGEPCVRPVASIRPVASTLDLVRNLDAVLAGYPLGIPTAGPPPTPIAGLPSSVDSAKEGPCSLPPPSQWTAG
jgi:hypothetical protein